MNLLLLLLVFGSMAVLATPLLKMKKLVWWALCIIMFSSLVITGIGTDSICRDGWTSPSIGVRGACSWHGGVVVELNKYGWIALIASTAIIIIWLIYIFYKKEPNNQTNAYPEGTIDTNLVKAVFEEDEVAGDEDFDTNGNPINRIREIVEENGEAKKVIFRDLSEHELDHRNRLKATAKQLADIFGEPSLISYSAYGGRRLYQLRWRISLEIEGEKIDGLIEDARNIAGDRIDDEWVIKSLDKEREERLRKEILKRI